jgi:cytoskeletal protein CcmA (bactofilin family)
MVLKRKREVEEPVREPAPEEPIPEPVKSPALPPGTTLAEGVLFKGNFQASEPMVVHGSIQGNVESTSDVAFTNKSHYRGDIRSVNLTIAGTAQGRFVCENRTQIVDAGRIEGTLHTARFIMSEDAVFEGDLKVIKTKPHAPQAPTEEAVEGDANPKGTGNKK